MIIKRLLSRPHGLIGVPIVRVPAAAFGIFLLVTFARAQDLPAPSPLPGPTPPAAAPSPIPTPMPVSPMDRAKPISLPEAIDRAGKQVTALTTANLNARIASEEVRQAPAAFVPKIDPPLGCIYSTPT